MLGISIAGPKWITSRISNGELSLPSTVLYMQFLRITISVRYQVSSVSAIDYSVESARLAELIKAYELS